MRISSVATEATKKITEMLVTSSLPPEEMLARLESYGIEWYLTEKGDLMIKYWQVGAEDFIPAEHVARISERQRVPPEGDMLEWVSRHLRELEAKYPGQWIAVVENEVVAAAADLPGLLAEVEGLGVRHPFVTQIPAGPIIWTTAYGG